MALCSLCLGGPAQHKATGYNLQVCDVCWQKAAAGWPREYEATLFNALAKAGLLIPDRNDQGKLPRAYQPPADYAL